MVIKMSKIAVVLIRGLVNLSPDVKKTLELMNLKKKHACVVLDDNEVSKGMLQKVKDYTTFGSIDEALFVDMLNKRGETIGKTKVSEDKKIDTKAIAKDFFAGKIKNRDLTLKHNIKPFFRLHPPIGGFEKKGIKMPFAKKGVLGDRKDKMSELITKML